MRPTTKMMHRVLLLVTLVIAGEMVFGLPFHLARFFRPTMLEVFGLTNTELGDIFAVYGIAATLSYFPGGALADRFSARRLLSLALIATSAGGLYMATIPGMREMALLYGYFGFTTIFLLWGGLIRATREWGGSATQGVAFGTLEAGRGLVAALVAKAGVLALMILMPDQAEMASDAERLAGMRALIFLYAGVAFAAGVLVWLVLPESDMTVQREGNPFHGMLEVMGRPLIWAQAMVVITAYCLFKGTDYYSLYAQHALGYDEVEAADLTASGSYIRAIAAFSAGLIADRFDAARSVGVAFAVAALALAGHLVFTPDNAGYAIMVSNALIVMFAVFALRGIYFALLEDTDTPRRITGAAVGLVSVVGFTPDIFFQPIAGRILDANPGVDGHLDLFLLLAAISAAGVVATGWLLWLKRHKLRPAPAD